MKKQHLIFITAGLIAGIAQYFYRTYTTITPSVSDCIKATGMQDCTGAYQTTSRGLPFHISDSSESLFLLHVNLLLFVLATLGASIATGYIRKKRR